MSLFPAPVQGKVFDFEIFGEEFWGLEARKRRKNLDFQLVIHEKICISVLKMGINCEYNGFYLI